MSDIKELKDKIKDVKILFVDDEEQIREGTGKFLKKFFDEVEICIDGLDGLAKFTKSFEENGGFDIVIADIQMPKMDGVSMVKKIKELKPNIFVIFITASRGKYDIQEGLYDLYITKPISYDDIKLIMQKASELEH